MSIRIMAQLWDLEINSTDKFVALALADHADDSGICWPGQSGIAKKCGMSERTVIRAINSLEEKRIIAVDRRINPDNGHKLNNIYKFLPSDKLSPRPCDKNDAIHVTQCHINHHVQSCTPKGDKKTYPQIKTAQLPKDWKPTDEFYKNLEFRQIPKPSQTQIDKFVNYHVGKGTEIRDPDALFTAWVLSDHTNKKNKVKNVLNNHKRSKPIPSEGNDLIAVAAEYGIKPGLGESWDKLKARVRNAMEKGDQK